MPESSASPSFRRRLRLAGLVTVGVAALVVVVGVVSRVRADQDVKAWTRQQAVPNVALARIEGGGERQLVLPGQLQAYATAQIRARVDGYLRRWYVDIGAPVKAGQLLAEIDAPDVDQQVMQARADLAQAQANQALAATTAQRWQTLVARDIVSKQAAEEKTGDLAAKTAAVNAARANLNRLQAMESFKRITAPFDGVVTSRATDVGALIHAGSASDAPLFTVADPRRLRIYVHVPQVYAPMVRLGMTATIKAPDYPGETFSAAVANDAQAVAAQSGAVLVELQLDNRDGRLKSGGYAQVAFDLPSAPSSTQIPASALMFRHEGPAVAVVGASGQVKIRPVMIARDLGETVEIASGVARRDRIIDNPPEALADGDHVRVTVTPRGAASARAKG